MVAPVPAGVDDRLPQVAIEHIGKLVEVMPDEFDLGAQQAHQKSITTTLRFPEVGVHAQIDGMARVLQASTVTPTLYRNLVEARRLLHSVLEEGDPGDELIDGIRHFLVMDA